MQVSRVQARGSRRSIRVAVKWKDSAEDDCLLEQALQITTNYSKFKKMFWHFYMGRNPSFESPRHLLLQFRSPLEHLHLSCSAENGCWMIHDGSQGGRFEGIPKAPC